MAQQQSSGDSEEPYDLLFKIVLIGDAGVGKTCIVQRFKCGTFIERHGSTIGVDFTMKTLPLDGKRVKVGTAGLIPCSSCSVFTQVLCSVAQCNLSRDVTFVETYASSIFLYEQWD